MLDTEERRLEKAYNHTLYELTSIKVTKGRTGPSERVKEDGV